MAAMKIEVGMPRRPAIVTISAAHAELIDMPAGMHDCFVLGVFSDTDEFGTVHPVFVCEMLNGKVYKFYTEIVRFVDVALDE